MSLEFGAGGGQGNIPLLLRDCLTAPWEVAFVTSREQCIEEQNSRPCGELYLQDAECLKTLTSAGGKEEQSGGQYSTHCESWYLFGYIEM